MELIRMSIMSEIRKLIKDLWPLSQEVASKLNIFRHDGYTFGVNSAHVSIFEKSNKINFTGFLNSENCCGLKTQISLEILRNFANKTLERGLKDKQGSAFLVLANFTKTSSIGLRLTFVASCSRGAFPVWHEEDGCRTGLRTRCLTSPRIKFSVTSNGPRWKIYRISCVSKKSINLLMKNLNKNCCLYDFIHYLFGLLRFMSSQTCCEINAHRSFHFHFRLFGITPSTFIIFYRKVLFLETKIGQLFGTNK